MIPKDSKLPGIKIPPFNPAGIAGTALGREKRREKKREMREKKEKKREMSATLPPVTGEELSPPPAVTLGLLFPHTFLW